MRLPWRRRRSAPAVSALPARPGDVLPGVALPSVAVAVPVPVPVPVAAPVPAAPVADAPVAPLADAPPTGTVPSVRLGWADGGESVLAAAAAAPFVAALAEYGGGRPPHPRGGAQG